MRQYSLSQFTLKSIFQRSLNMYKHITGWMQPSGTICKILLINCQRISKECSSSPSHFALKWVKRRGTVSLWVNTLYLCSVGTEVRSHMLLITCIYSVQVVRVSHFTRWRAEERNASNKVSECDWHCAGLFSFFFVPSRPWVLIQMSRKVCGARTHERVWKTERF